MKYLWRGRERALSSNEGGDAISVHHALHFLTPDAISIAMMMSRTSLLLRDRSSFPPRLSSRCLWESTSVVDCEIGKLTQTSVSHLAVDAVVVSPPVESWMQESLRLPVYAAALKEEPNPEAFCCASHGEDNSEEAGFNKNGGKVMAESKEQLALKRMRVRAPARWEKASQQDLRRPRPKKLRSESSSSVNDSVGVFLKHNGSRERRLLTAEEELMLTQGIQDLLVIETVKVNLEEKYKRALTIAEWARALEMELGAFIKRLSYGRKCKDTMIRRNLRLVISVAKKYQGKGVSLEDLIQAGSMGLAQGCYKYNPSKGCRFSTYAHWPIRQGVVKVLGDHSRTVRLPARIIDILTRINRIKVKLTEEHRRRPREHEVARAMGLGVKRLRALVAWSKFCVSMDKHIGSEDQKSTLRDLLEDCFVEEPPDPFISLPLMRSDIEHALSGLKPRERQIVVLRFGLDGGAPRTLSEIGELLCVTKERVRQIEAKAMAKLKQPEINCCLQSYLKLFL